MSRHVKQCQEAKHTAAKNDASYFHEIVRDLTGSRPNISIPMKNTMQQWLSDDSSFW